MLAAEDASWPSVGSEMRSGGNPESFTACLLNDGLLWEYEIAYSGRLNGAQRNRPMHREAQVGGVLIAIGMHCASVLE